MTHLNIPKELKHYEPRFQPQPDITAQKGQPDFQYSLGNFANSLFTFSFSSNFNNKFHKNIAYRPIGYFGDFKNIELVFDIEKNQLWCIDFSDPTDIPMFVNESAEKFRLVAMCVDDFDYTTNFKQVRKNQAQNIITKTENLKKKLHQIDPLAFKAFRTCFWVDTLFEVGFKFGTFKDRFPECFHTDFEDFRIQPTTSNKIDASNEPFLLF